MRFDLLVTTTVLLLLFNSVSGFPRFFPNISSIPPSLLPNITVGAGAWQSFQNFTGCHMGDHASGFAKLKDYFHQFGYITDSPSNFTDDFDDAFESALKTYQLNFNLNPTGVLDDGTLKQIVLPRCGVPDIINGSSSMNSGKSASSTHGSFRTVAHYSFFPGQPRWPSSNRDLTYGFLPENQLSDSVKALFSRAFSRWSAVTPLKFTEAQFYYTADIKIGFYSGDHGDGEPFDGVLGTLAHAFSPPSGRFHLDEDENWVVDGDVRTSRVLSAVDLESVAVHEIGHLLGLGHSSVEDAIMFPTISSGNRKVELASDDVQGIQVLYGANPNYNGSSSSTPSSSGQDREWSDSGAQSVAVWWGLSIVITVGSALLLL